MAKTGRPRIVDLIPTGFRCPRCGEPKPNPHQWAVITYGREAICRSCLSQSPGEMCPAVDVPNQVERPASERIEKYYVVVNGQPVSAAGQCVMGCGNLTRRVEGYCSPCRYALLRECHGGMGAHRVDKKGRCFVVFNDEAFAQRTPKSIPREAYYAWGRELLPRAMSEPSDESAYQAQREYMWRGAEVFLDHAVTVAQKKAGKLYCDDMHDAAVEAACRAVLCYDPKRAQAMFETYLYRCVINAVRGVMAKERQRQRRLRTVSMENVRNQLNNCKEAVYHEHDHAQLIESLGLTAFERKVMHMRHVEGLTLEVIGHRYGVTKSTVHGWIHRATAKARRNGAEYGSQGAH